MVIVAPLNWGLGHATRCIPLIRSLEEHGFGVIIASDGQALALLKEEFPGRELVELPSYNVRYTRKGSLFKLKLITQTPNFIRVMREEQSVLDQLINTRKVSGIISDNRFGARNERVPSVFITHQLNVLSGTTTWLSTKAHRKIIDGFDQCWVPDIEGPLNLSGKLGHPREKSKKVRYIGVLSRMKKRAVPKKYDLLCVLSGPEPQRSILEERLVACFENDHRRTLLVRGVIEDSRAYKKIGYMEVVNFLTSAELEEVFNQSELIIARSGYTTLMDLSVLEKKAFFIPTPGQFEQEYLARRCKEKGIAPYCSQEEFGPDRLLELPAYKGFSAFNKSLSLDGLFGSFESK